MKEEGDGGEMKEKRKKKEEKEAFIHNSSR